MAGSRWHLQAASETLHTAQLRTVINCACSPSLQNIFAIVPVPVCLCMSGLFDRWWIVLHGGLHLTWKDKVVSVVGVDRPTVLRLSLRLAGFGSVGGVGGLGLTASVVREASFVVTQVGCL